MDNVDLELLCGSCQVGMALGRMGVLVSIYAIIQGVGVAKNSVRL
jgi:hypothetical protein